MRTNCPNDNTLLVARGNEMVCTQCGYAFSNGETKPSKGSTHIQVVNTAIKTRLTIARISAMADDSEEKAEVPWKERYVTIDHSNYDSNRKYSGINRLFLSFANDVFFLTKESAEKKGLSLKDNALPFTVVYWVMPKLTKAEEKLSAQVQKDILAKKHPFMVTHQVYSSKDVIGIPEKNVTGKNNRKYNSVEEFIKGCGIQIDEGGNVADYSWSADAIRMPSINQYGNSDDYYRDLFKQIAHATGNKDRLNRDAKKFGRDKDNGKEELIGEIASAYICQYFGIQVADSTVEYIDKWMKAIDNDAYLLVSAAQQSEKVYKHLKLGGE